MKIGLPKEIKNNENRVGLTPHAVKQLTSNRHQVFVEKGAGIGSGFSDQEYIKAGAKIVPSAKMAWNQAMVIKVKEPLPSEYKYFKPNLILFTYFHIADNKELTKELLKTKVTAIAYETMRKDGMLPLLAPMSRVAGRRATIVAATHLESHHGGMGLLPGGVDDNDPKKPTTEKGLFMIVGGGVVGYNAATTAAGLGSNLVIFERNLDRIQQLKSDEKLKKLTTIFKSKFVVEESTFENIYKWIGKADAVISTILIPGAKAQKVISSSMVQQMKPGSVIVDVAIDQGGSVETIDHSTTHDKPTFVKFGVNHYAVANMPGATSRTATAALVNATTEYALKIAKDGVKSALKDKTIYDGINTIAGHLTMKPVADALTIKYEEAKKFI